MNQGLWPKCGCWMRRLKCYKALSPPLMTPFGVASDVWYLQSTRLPPSSGVPPRSNNSFRSAWPERAIVVKPDNNSSQICS